MEYLSHDCKSQTLIDVLHVKLHPSLHKSQNTLPSLPLNQLKNFEENHQIQPQTQNFQELDPTLKRANSCFPVKPITYPGTDKAGTKSVEEGGESLGRLSSVKISLEKALQLKKEASLLAKEKRFEEAIENFNKAIEILEGMETEDNINYAHLIANKIECMVNIAISLLNMKKFEEVIAITDKILSHQKNNVRGLYLKAKALKSLGNLHEALDHIQHALTIKANKCLYDELNELREKLSLNKSPSTTSVSHENIIKDNVVSNKKPSNLMWQLLKVLFSKLFETIRSNKLLVAALLALLALYARSRFIVPSSTIMKLVYSNGNI